MPKITRIAPEPPTPTWRLELSDEEASALRQFLGDSSTIDMKAVSPSLIRIYDVMYDARIKRLDSK